MKNDCIHENTSLKDHHIILKPCQTQYLFSILCVHCEVLNYHDETRLKNLVSVKKKVINVINIMIFVKTVLIVVY